MSHLDALTHLPHRAPPEAMAALAALSVHLDTLDDRAARVALAEAMPRRVASLAPEVSVALSGIATRLVAHGVQPPADLDHLEDRPRVAWLRLRVLVGGVLPDEADLARVVAGWTIDAVPQPAALLRALAAASDPALRHCCLRWVPCAVAGLGLSARAAFDQVADLAGDADWTVRRAALRSPAFTARVGLTHVQASRREDALLAGLHAEAPEVVAAALATCADLGRGDWLADYARDTSRPLPARADALARFGAAATQADLPWVLALGQAPDLRAAVRAALLAAHRRGAFLDAAALPAVLAQFDAHPGWTAAEVVRVTWLARDALIDQLMTCPADDRRWVRRARILAESPVAAAADHLARLLGAATDLTVLSALIDAAGRAPGFRAVAALSAHLDRLPEATLTALRAKADRAALERVNGLAQAPATGPRLRRRAHDVLWAYWLDPGLVGRAGALVALDTGDAPSDLIADRTPQAQLERLCRTASRHALPAIQAAFRASVIDCVRAALAGDFSVKRVDLPAIEQLIYRYGRALIAKGQAVRRWVADAPETGRDVLLRLICDWLDEAPERPICVALLEMAARHAPDGAWLRRIEPFWRHGDREVQRAAVDAILGAGEAAAGLALSLSRLVEARAGRIAERGLEAVRTFEARWAEPLVIAALGRPEMAVKKAAAEALATVASPAAIPALLDWLARHDNRAWRALLKAALQTAAGTQHAALLVDAFANAAEARRRDLLLDALDGVLSLAGLIRLAQSARGVAAALVDAVAAERLRLADASRDVALARLHRLHLREAAPPADDPAAALMTAGFTPARAEAVLAAWLHDADPRCLRAVRARLGEWLGWCPSDAAARLAVAAADRSQKVHLDALLALAPRVGAAVALPFIERCVVDPTPAQRQRAIACVRTLPLAPLPGGLARFERLLALEAVVTGDDLRRCLAECAMGSPGAAEAVLRRAFPALPEPLRAGITGWAELPDAERAAWLDAALSRCPIGQPPLATPSRQRDAPPAPIGALVAALDDPDRREAAFTALAARPAAAEVWPTLLIRVLAGELAAPRAVWHRLAAHLRKWPVEPDAHAVAFDWFGALTPAQLRGFVPAWIARRAAGDRLAEACLQRTPDDILLPIIWAQRAVDPTLARLVAPHESQAIHALAAWLAEHAPAEAERFARPPVEPPSAEPLDPMAGLALPDLCRLIADPDTAHGLAVRAVHALTAAGDAAIEPLAALAVDPRAKVRSAALRALKTVASRARTLHATLTALQMETRRDVILQRMRSLGHGRYAPALPALIDRVVHPDARVADGAIEALIGFGDAALPALEHAARRARPDRRPRYRQVIAAIEG